LKEGLILYKPIDNSSELTSNSLNTVNLDNLNELNEDGIEYNDMNDNDKKYGEDGNQMIDNVLMNLYN
jgi:hypothetical protein